MKTLDITLLLIMISMIILAITKEKTIEDIEEELNNKGGI